MINKTEMMPMEYGKDLGIGNEVLYFEKRDDGFEIVVLNIRGSHPCSYINVPQSFLDKYGGKPKLNYYYWDGDVHGGFTYAEKYLNAGNERLIGYWLGWDYGHFGDYTYVAPVKNIFGIPMTFEGFFNEDEKKWTTEEIVEEAYKVIDTLVYYGNNEYEEDE